MTGNHLLLAIDGTDAGGAAVDFTVGHAAAIGADVTVFHVREISPLLRVPPPESATTARSVVEEAVTTLRSAGVRTIGLTCTAREDAVARRIVEVATDRQCTGIVLGSLRLQGLSRLAGGGVRERVVRSSHLPVLVAPAALAYRRRSLSAELSRRGRGAELPAGVLRTGLRPSTRGTSGTATRRHLATGAQVRPPPDHRGLDDGGAAAATGQPRASVDGGDVEVVAPVTAGVDVVPERGSPAGHALGQDGHDRAVERPHAGRPQGPLSGARDGSRRARGPRRRRCCRCRPPRPGRAGPT